MTALRIAAWKPLGEGSLLSLAWIELRSGMVQNEVAIHTSNGSASASPSALPPADRSGTGRGDQNNKVRYQSLVQFGDAATGDRFSVRLIGAEGADHAEALADAQ